MAAYNDCKSLFPHSESIMLNLQSVDPLPCLAHLPTLIADVKEFMSTHDTSKLPKYLMDALATYNDCKALLPHQQALVYNFQAVSPVNTLEKCLSQATVLIPDFKELMSNPNMSEVSK